MKHISSRSIARTSAYAALGLLSAAPLPGQSNRPTLDLSGVVVYWAAVDGLREGRYGADSAAALLATHPGYRLIQRNGGRLRALTYCFHKMSMRTAADSSATAPASRADLYEMVCRHLAEAGARRDSLTRFARELERNGGVLQRAAHDSVRAYLPTYALSDGPPPVHVLVFENNGFGGAEIALDLLRLMRDESENLPRFLAHELHHSYMQRLPADTRDDGDASAAAGLRWLQRVQWEGIASLIDKGYLMSPRARDREAFDAGLGEFVKDHLERIRNAPSTLERIERAFQEAAGAGATGASRDSVLQESIADGGHALGQYLATAIDRVLGRQALIATTTSRFAFVEAYQRAASQRPTQFRPLGAHTTRYFATLKQQYANQSR